MALLIPNVLHYLYSCFTALMRGTGEGRGESSAMPARKRRSTGPIFASSSYGRRPESSVLLATGCIKKGKKIHSRIQKMSSFHTKKSSPTKKNREHDNYTFKMDIYIGTHHHHISQEPMKS